ncbi:unnamed protein product [Dicrocoelium dendriticum]|nr:unnamed protein product [Dicrocoelium dendriticum]
MPPYQVHRDNSLEGNLKTVDTISSQCHPDAKPHTLAASTKRTPTPIPHPGMSDQGEEERETGIQPIRFSLGSQRLLSPDKTKISLGMKNPESRVSDASLSLTLPLVAFGGTRIGTGLTNTHQPSWKNSRRSKMADIKERFSRTAKIKYTDQNTGITEGIGGDFDASPDRGNIQTFSRNGGTRCRSPAPGGNNTMWNGSRQPSLDTPHGDSDFDSLPHRNFAKATNRNSAETYLKMSENERKYTCECSTLFRSLTDSDVVYHKQEKIEEVPGAMHYITLDGQLDYSVVLRALFWRCTTYMSDRVCKQVLGCLCVLFDLGIIINHRNTRPSTRIQRKKSFKFHDKRKTYDFPREKIKVHPAANFYSSTGKEPIQPNQFSRQTTTTSGRKDGRTTGMPSVHRKSLTAFVESGDDEPKQSLGQVDRCKVYSSKETESVGRLCPQDQFRLDDSKVLEDAATTNTRERTAGDVCRFPRRQTSRSRWSHYVQSPYQLQQPALSKQMLRSNYVLAVETVLRVIRSLGCPYGHHCSPSFGFRETPGNGERDLPTQEKDEVRRLAYDCVHHLYKTDGNWFVHVISRMVATMCVPDLVELYHALTGFCSDPAARATGYLPTDANYANSFNQAAIVSGTLEVESIIIACSLGPFIRRLVRCRVEIVSQENLSLFGDIRQLFSYLREVHGSTFRLNILVALICPIHRVWERLRPKSAAGCSRMSSRNSMWLFPRVDKRRSSSLFTDGLVDADPAGFGAGGLRTGQRITSWHMFLPRSSVVSRGFRLSNGLGSWPTFDRDGTHGRKDLEHSGQETVVEHRWVNVSALKEGLLDFSFLLECCEPGTIPEPQLVAALFDLVSSFYHVK